MKAVWNNRVIAESPDTVIVEGNHYFPKDSLDMSLIIESQTTSHCPWKGDASYYSIEVDGKVNEDAVWYYPSPSELAKGIKDRVAFWKGVEVLQS
jgi:uncharacterized protein (DUF427 family)